MKRWTEAYKEKFIEPKELKSTCERLRSEGKTIATLNGSFDLLHAGHLHILYEASKTADCLIVCLNSDTSIKEYKSPLRPIVPLEYRLQMMAAIEFVDYVTFFDETTPIEILKKIRPDVHNNGAEYTKDCIEAETVRQVGGTINLISLIDGLSTTSILTTIETIQNKEAQCG